MQPTKGEMILGLCLLVAILVCFVVWLLTMPESHWKRSFVLVKVCLIVAMIVKMVQMVRDFGR